MGHGFANRKLEGSYTTRKPQLGPWPQVREGDRWSSSYSRVLVFSWQIRHFWWFLLVESPCQIRSPHVKYGEIPMFVAEITSFFLLKSSVFDGVWWSLMDFDGKSGEITSFSQWNHPFYGCPGPLTLRRCSSECRTHCPATMAEAPCTTATSAELQAEFTWKNVGKAMVKPTRNGNSMEYIWDTLGIF